MHYLPGSYNSVWAVLYIAKELLGLAAVCGAAFEVLYSEENLPRLWSVMQEALNYAERDMVANRLWPGGGGSARGIEDASRLW
jgi:hypothetical protein